MSTFGTLFRVHTFGESHCLGVGCVIDGVPPGLPLSSERDIQPQLTRRRPGQSALTTPRDEKDRVHIQSGVECGVTLGTPVSLFVRNEDQRPHDYSNIDIVPRPSHADYTYLLKYGVKATSGGGRSSARETIGRVAAGAVAEKYLHSMLGVEIVAFVDGAGEYSASHKDIQQVMSTVTREQVDSHITRCPFPALAQQIEDLVIQCRDAKDSVGGTVCCVIRNMPAGLGEPCFDKLEAKLAHAMLSIPATKGFEVGSGFEGTKMRGSQHNDMFVKGDCSGGGGGGDVLKTLTNNSGGIQGGISNGGDVYFRCAFKPPATIGITQSTSTYSGDEATLAAKGRHDPCVVPRAVPIVEAMAALVIMDAVMMQYAREGCTSRMPKLAVDDLTSTVTEDPQQLIATHQMLTGGASSKPHSIQKK